MREVANYSGTNNIGTSRRILSLIILFILLAGLSLGLSCSGKEKPTEVVLELISSPVTMSGSDETFDETNSKVLRCISLIEAQDRITAVVSKAKSDEIMALIFVNNADLEACESCPARVAYVKPENSENEYDISEAFYRRVSFSSAVDAVNEGGLPYEDWMTGTLSQDELFPCCQ